MEPEFGTVIYLESEPQLTILHRSIEMAQEFPHTSVVAVDLAPAPIAPGLLPPNCRMEVGDIIKGLPEHHGIYDLVHCRALSSGVSCQG